MNKEKENRTGNDFKENVNLLLDKLEKNKTSLKIDRLPIQTKRAFVDLAHKEFCGDYGFLLKWLIDDQISMDNRMIMNSLQELNARVEQIEIQIENGINVSTETKEETKSTRKMLDGTERKVKND